MPPSSSTEEKLTKTFEYLEREMKKRLEVKDNKYMLKTHKQCFAASEAVDFMVSTGRALCRQEAVEMGKVLQLQRYFMEHVNAASGNTDHFQDEKKMFFRFLTDKKRREKGFDTKKGKKSQKNLAASGDISKIIKFSCEVTILAGRKLAPKDRILGIGRSSDPFVEIWADDELYGTTPVKKMTLDPTWDSDNRFIIQMEEAYHLPPPKLELKIFDEDFGQDPDAMGAVAMIVPARNDDTTEWYTVPPNSAKNAKGELQVRIQTSRCRESKGSSGRERPGKKGKKNTTNPNRNKSNGIFSNMTRDRSPHRSKSTPADTSAATRSPTPSPEPPPLPVKPRRSMNDTLVDLPQLKIRNCDEILNENSYWEERVEQLGWEIEDLEDRIEKTSVFQKHANSRNSIMPIVEHLQQEVQERAREKDKRLQEKFMNSCDKIQLKVTIIQGIGLVAKDQDDFGRWVSSDPYVEVWKDRKNLGKTRTAEATLDPMWNEQFIFVVSRRNPPKIALRIWDEDYADEPDRLGTVTITTPTEEMEITEWHAIPRGTNNEQDATGCLQVRVESDLIVDKMAHAEELQKRVDELEHSLKQSMLVSKAGMRRGRNSLEPTMQFLLEKNKALAKETMALESTLEE
jgi:hypothetical protein